MLRRRNILKYLAAIFLSSAVVLNCGRNYGQQETPPAPSTAPATSPSRSSAPQASPTVPATPGPEGFGTLAAIARSAMFGWYERTGRSVRLDTMLSVGDYARSYETVLRAARSGSLSDADVTLVLSWLGCVSNIQADGLVLTEPNLEGYFFARTYYFLRRYRSERIAGVQVTTRDSELGQRRVSLEAEIGFLARRWSDEIRANAFTYDNAPGRRAAFAAETLARLGLFAHEPAALADRPDWPRVSYPRKVAVLHSLQVFRSRLEDAYLSGGDLASVAPPAERWAEMERMFALDTMGWPNFPLLLAELATLLRLAGLR